MLHHLRKILLIIISLPLFLGRFYSYLHQRTNAYQKFKIPEFVNSSTPNPLYPKALSYVSSLKSVEESCSPIIIGTNSNTFHLQPSANEHIGDEFDGVQIYWTSVPGCLHLRVKHTDRCRMLGLYLEHIQGPSESATSSGTIQGPSESATTSSGAIQGPSESATTTSSGTIQGPSESATTSSGTIQGTSESATSSGTIQDDDVPNKGTKAAEETDLESISVKALVRNFEQRIDRKRNRKKEPHFLIPNGEGKVVIYTTSLRGIRRTFDECQLVKLTLHGYNFKIEERDVSMHMPYRQEISQLIHSTQNIPLPSVFANGVYIGGAEEVRRVHEAGELDNVFQECEKLHVQNGGGDCQLCGGYSFLPCQHCSGAHKVFVQHGENGAGFQPCSLCNENGLVRCSLCL